MLDATVHSNLNASETLGTQGASSSKGRCLFGRMHDRKQARPYLRLIKERSMADGMDRRGCLMDGLTLLLFGNRIS